MGSPAISTLSIPKTKSIAIKKEITDATNQTDPKIKFFILFFIARERGRCRGVRWL